MRCVDSKTAAVAPGLILLLVLLGATGCGGGRGGATSSGLGGTPGTPVSDAQREAVFTSLADELGATADGTTTSR